MKRLKILAPLAALAVLVSLAACGAGDTTGEEVTDAWITSKVKANLTADPEVNPFEIDVDTEDGVVRLSGLVETDLQREEAAELAKRTKGVVSVINDIELGDLTMAENVDDAWVAASVESKLASDPEINPFDIDVDVLDGVVTLTGAVDSDLARQHAEELARRTEGVDDVENLLTLAASDMGSPS